MVSDSHQADVLAALYLKRPATGHDLIHLDNPLTAVVAVRNKNNERQIELPFSFSPNDPKIGLSTVILGQPLAAEHSLKTGDTLHILDIHGEV